MRPKKPRFLDGIQLADSLYPDPRRRPGYYLYLFPDRKRSVFQARSVDEANVIAAEALQAFQETGGQPPDEKPSRHMTAFHIPTYAAWMERMNPKLVGKSQWYNDKIHFAQFAREKFPHLAEIVFDGKTDSALHSWWDTLSYYQQKQRLAAFRRWFNWMAGKGLLPNVAYNPFTTDDSRHRLLVKSKPKKRRPPLLVQAYQKIRHAAGELGYECLQWAMDLSLYTTMREDDICSLQRKAHLHAIEDNHWLLRVVVKKSESQHGAIGAARLEWDTREHPVLKTIIDRLLELCLANKGCPYLISHTPRRRVWNDKKTHICQVTPDRLSHMFTEARAHSFPDMQFSKERPGPSFHEVRGLSSTLYRKAGYTDEKIQALMAHENVNTTRGYMDLGELPFEAVDLRLPSDLFG